MASEKLEKRLLTVKEVADYLRVNQTTIYRLLRRSEIPAFKVGGDWRFNIESIDDWRLSADHGASRRSSRAMSSSIADTSHATAVLVRIYEAMSQIIGPLGEIRELIPALKRIVEALEGQRDTSDQIASLYADREISFQIDSENLLKFVPAPFGAADAHRRLVSFNDAYCQLFGFQRKHLRNMRLMDLVHHDDLDRFMVANERLWQAKHKSARFVGRRLTASGAAIATRSTAWPIRPKSGAKPEYMAAVIERIADPKEASALFTQCADKLSQRRERLLSCG